MFAVKDWRQFGPGVLLTLGIAATARGLSPYLPSAFGGETLAMVLGLLVGNLWLTGKRWQAGVKWSEKYPIEVGIALLGFTMTTTALATLGWNGLGFVLLLMGATLVGVTWLGKLLGLNPAQRYLMAAGNAVCGSSAIAAVAPEIKANDQDRRLAVATVSLSGAVLVLVLPLIGAWLVGDTPVALGALIGGTVQSVGQVVGAASLVNVDVVTYATLFKMIRVILLSGVVLGFSYLMQRQNANAEATQPRFKVKIPWFVWVFLAGILWNTLMPLPQALLTVDHSLVAWAGTINLAGIGLNLRWSLLKQSGKTYLIYGGVTLLGQIALAVLLIQLLHVM